ncbi:hypothetical protein [Kibdelosporangium aridum]|uniref:hypothetical protein n=1 Tax=Kibdelosporangium aridum TaxID=2030 RepID=UPI000527E84E
MPLRTVDGVLADPDSIAPVVADSPVATVTREVISPVRISETELAPGTVVAAVLASANRPNFVCPRVRGLGEQARMLNMWVPMPPPGGTRSTCGVVKIKRLIGMVLAAVCMIASMVVASGPAAADTNCGSGVNDVFLANVREATATAGGRTVTVKLVNQRVSDHSFARITLNYRSGDLTWVDRSYDGGRTWTQCGPFNRAYSNDLSNLNNWMRACARFNGHSFCTGWYRDTD